MKIERYEKWFKSIKGTDDDSLKFLNMMRENFFLWDIYIGKVKRGLNPLRPKFKGLLPLNE